MSSTVLKAVQEIERRGAARATGVDAVHVVAEARRAWSIAVAAGVAVVGVALATVALVRSHRVDAPSPTRVAAPAGPAVAAARATAPAPAAVAARVAAPPPVAQAAAPPPVLAHAPAPVAQDAAPPPVVAHAAAPAPVAQAAAPPPVAARIAPAAAPAPVAAPAAAAVAARVAPAPATSVAALAPLPAPVAAVAEDEPPRGQVVANLASDDVRTAPPAVAKRRDVEPRPALAAVAPAARKSRPARGREDVDEETEAPIEAPANEPITTSRGSLPRVDVRAIAYSQQPGARSVTLRIGGGAPVTLHEGESLRGVDVQLIMPNSVYLRHGGSIFALGR